MVLKVMKNGEFTGSYVKYNSCLDYYDGRNYGDSGIGTHLGITKLRSTEEYVLIYGTQWIGQADEAEVVSDELALEKIIENGHQDLLEEKKFERLKTLFEKNFDEEP